jgi:hypothetical protein
MTKTSLEQYNYEITYEYEVKEENVHPLFKAEGTITSQDVQGFGLTTYT